MHISTTTASTMFTYDFMQNAFAAAGIVAVVCGLVGFFLVLRAQTFAGHALSHVGFAGATGAVLLGVAPLWGLVALTLLAGIGMGLLGERLHQRDVAIGIVLAMSLGLGLLFLHFFTAYATQATALLFGNILGVDAATVWTLLLLGTATTAALALISRPLLFASLQPELAEARGVSLRLISVLFLVIVALAVAQCAQIVGVLLVFALMVGPAAAAQRLTTRFWFGIVLSVALAMAEAWFALVLAYVTDWPTSFWITALSGCVYLAAVMVDGLCDAFVEFELPSKPR
jgi:zinc/manganese transport system permease protein